MSAIAEVSAIKYAVTESDIEALGQRYSDLKKCDEKNYEVVKAAANDAKSVRIGIEKRRLELNADAQQHIKNVNSVAKVLTAKVQPIENRLLLLKQEVDDQRAADKLAKEQAELKKLHDEYVAEQAAEKARQQKIKDEEAAKLKAEQDRLAADRAKLEADRKNAEEAQAAARQKLDDERRKLDAEKAAMAAKQAEADRTERERLAKIKQEADAKAKADQERIATEEAAARLEALKPDAEKLKAFAATLMALTWPMVESEEADSVMLVAANKVDSAIELLSSFAS